MNGASSKEGELALLTLSLHHNKSDGYGLYASEIKTLAADIATIWSNPKNLVITVVNANPRGGDMCMEHPTWCLRDELAALYGVSLDAKEALWTSGFSGQMGIIGGPDWDVTAGIELYPEWVRRTDVPNLPVPGIHCPENPQIDHYGVFQLQQHVNPDVRIKIYDAYLCMDGGFDTEARIKKIRYVLNRATEERGLAFSPLITGDWNAKAHTYRDTAPNSFADEFGSWTAADRDYFVDLRDHDMALTVQQELRDRTSWISDRNANPCTALTPGAPSGNPGTNSFPEAEGYLHLAQVRQPWSQAKLLTPVFHPIPTFSYDKVGQPQPVDKYSTIIHFSTVSHPGYLTVFKTIPLEPPPATSVAGLPLRFGASSVPHPGCGVVHGYPGSVMGGPGCTVNATAAFTSPVWTGLRVGVMGVANRDATLRLRVVGEHKLYDLPGQPVTATQHGATLTEMDIGGVSGAFCKSAVISGRKGRPFDVTVEVLEGGPVRIDRIGITDLGGDPCGSCATSCPAGACGGPDGCGGICGCPTNLKCDAGECRPKDCLCLDKCGCNDCGKFCECPAGQGCFDGGECKPKSTCKAPDFFCKWSGDCLPLDKCHPGTPTCSAP